jgi:hypothetical protein
VVDSVCLAGPGFTDRLNKACQDFLTLWDRTSPVPPELGPKVGLWQQHSNARAASRLIDEIASEIARLPDDESERHQWRERVRARLQSFGNDRLGWPDGYRRLLFGDGFYESSVSFARAARAFDPGVTVEQLGQALRNVWIGNSLQMLLDRPVKMRPGLFAYSMLYPVTDNWLDDTRVSRDVKRSFNLRFGERLAGHQVNPVSEQEAAVCRLVSQIEDDLPREHFPDVYASLLAIHGGQTRSLDQHDTGSCRLTDRELLFISFEKGGSSVLADLYLVAPEPEPLEEQFAFGYGVFLQLLDDLQDVEPDLAAGHETLFTRAADVGLLDNLTARLAHFIAEVLAISARFQGPEYADRIDLIRRNSYALLVGSISEQPRRFSRRFRRQLARRWPISFRASRRLRRRALSRWNTLRAGGSIPDPSSWPEPAATTGAVRR